MMKCAVVMILVIVEFMGSSNAAENGVTSSEILIGQSASLTGGNAEYGKQILSGANAFFGAVNRAGGVHQRKIRLISLDDGSQGNKAKENSEVLLKKEKVFALFGYTARNTSEIGMAAATEEKTPFFGAATGGESLRVKNRYVLNVRAGYRREYEYIVDVLASTGHQTFGILVNDDDKTNSNRNAIENALKKHGLKPSVVVQVDRNNADFKGVDAPILEANPAIFMLAGSGKPIAPLVRRLRERGYTGQFATNSFGAGLIKQLDEQAVGLIVAHVVPLPTRTSSTLVRNAARDLKEAGIPEGPSLASIEGYMTAQVLVEGLKRAGKNVTKEGFIDAMEQMNSYKVSDEIVMRFSPDNHHGGSYVDISIVGKNLALIN